MIEELKPYPSHRATGVYWLPQVPAHWEVVRSKHVFAERTELARAGDVQLSATQAYGVIPQAEFERRVGRRVVRISMHLDKRSHVEKGDFVISMRSFQGGLERAWASGAIRSSYVILRPARDLDLGYFTHLFKAQPYIKALQATGNFIRDGQDLTFSNFSRVDLPVPPYNEQLAIGRFLDHANRRIDRFIRAKKKLIALLNEQKQAIIHRAVTRGLDPNVKMKDSGVPWLGEVPAHFEIAAIRRHWEVVDCKHLTVPFVAEGIPLASVVEVRDFELNLSRSKKTTAGWYRMLIDGDRKPKRGDLIYCRNASVGNVAIVCTDEDFAMGQDVCLIRSKHQSQRFLNYVLHSPFMTAQLDLILIGSTFKRINLADIKTLTVLVPPRAEQKAICAHLDTEVRSFDEAIVKARQQVDLMREYRTRLIADVVTGQLDVRAAAASLPDLDPDTASPESSDDETELDDAEDAT